MTLVSDDVVVLDVNRDSYTCIVGGGAFLTPDGHGTVSISDGDLADELIAAGFVHAGFSSSPARALVAARGQLAANSRPNVFLYLETVFRTAMATSAFRGRSLQQLVEEGTRPVPNFRGRNLTRIKTRVSVYQTVLPWIPFEGACLQRTFQLRRILRADGHDVDWVFGVRTWPFFAHCWLQIDDLVVGDRLERVKAFTPIAIF